MSSRLRKATVRSRRASVTENRGLRRKRPGRFASKFAGRKRRDRAGRTAVTRELRRMTATDSERGFVIVAVLWILAALSALATIFSVYLSNSAQALAISDTGLQAEALASASLELTTYQLMVAGDKARPAQGSFH